MTNSKKQLPRNIETALNNLMEEVTVAMDGSKEEFHRQLKQYRYAYKKWGKDGYDITPYRNHDEEIIKCKKRDLFKDLEA